MADEKQGKPDLSSFPVILRTILEASAGGNLEDLLQEREERARQAERSGSEEPPRERATGFAQPTAPRPAPEDSEPIGPSAGSPFVKLIPLAIMAYVAYVAWGAVRSHLSLP